MILALALLLAIAMRVTGPISPRQHCAMAQHLAAAAVGDYSWGREARRRVYAGRTVAEYRTRLAALRDAPSLDQPPHERHPANPADVWRVMGQPKPERRVPGASLVGAMA